ncbi:hypothetical protein ACR782_15635 [Sphingobacterium spiritivorum]|uniref:hypothetical protein n=1 Tax=Sphingobacterium spiritivorum TaxID=258 RepID=UPI003DA34B4C
MKDPLQLKERLVKHIKETTDRRLLEIDTALVQAQESANDDTKSSAGDKYETSREMIQQDINRLQQQRAEVIRELDIINKIEQEGTEVGKLGALVVTDRFTYFVATSLGQLVIKGNKYAVVSAQSPIGKQLIGKEKGQDFEFNGIRQTIKGIY